RARHPAVSLSEEAMSITVLGASHRTAPLEVRERFAHEPREVPASLARVLAAGAGGGVLLSTCNRTEFYLAEGDDAVPEVVWALLSERLGGGRNASTYGYTQRDRDAVRHLYRVSAGLDAMILGESQVQGQVRDAWETSTAQAGPVLHRLFQSALLVGSRVRSETGLATGAASAPSAAVAVAARIFTRLAGRSALILGAGDMAELAATCLVSEGVRVTLVANRTYERARAVAEQPGARALTLDEAWEHFADADIVLSSTAAPHAVVTWDRVAPAVARRRGRPLCILDLGMPRDVEPSVAQLENVFLYDIDDLQAVAAQAAAERRGDIPAAERIVSEEAERFSAWSAEMKDSVLVTGGAGYIGSVVVAQLLARGYPVVVLDDLSRGHRAAVAPEATFVQGGVGDRAALDALLRSHRCHALVHLAAYALVGESVAEPEMYRANNVTAGRVLLERA